ncbi:MAG TPA: ribosome maturation factor RimM [Mycobacteriales bacterium]|nr:ribosome maturation factor RimM [Mycobacteriales bacterium]
MPPAPDDLVVVGRVGRPQGVRGEVTVEVRTDAPDERFAPGAVLLTEPADRGPLTVDRARDHSGRLVVRFEGVGDRTAAEALRDTLLLVDVRTLAPLEDPDEFHDWQLRGLRAETGDGRPAGVVADVLHLPHGDVLVVRVEDGTDGREVLVPFVRDIVPVVDVAAGRVVLTPPEGLMEP